MVNYFSFKFISNISLKFSFIIYYVLILIYIYSQVRIFKLYEPNGADINIDNTVLDPIRY